MTCFRMPFMETFTLQTPLISKTPQSQVMPSSYNRALHLRHCFRTAASHTHQLQCSPCIRPTCLCMLLPAFCNRTLYPFAFGDLPYTPIPLRGASTINPHPSPQSTCPLLTTPHLSPHPRPPPPHTLQNPKHTCQERSLEILPWLGSRDRRPWEGSRGGGPMWDPPGTTDPLGDLLGSCLLARACLSG